MAHATRGQVARDIFEVVARVTLGKRIIGPLSAQEIERTILWIKRAQKIGRSRRDFESNIETSKNIQPNQDGVLE